MRQLSCDVQFFCVFDLIDKSYWFSNEQEVAPAIIWLIHSNPLCISAINPDSYRLADLELTLVNSKTELPALRF